MDAPVVAKDIKRTDLLQMYYYLRLTRTLEDRITALYRQGKLVGGVYTSNGMEAISVGCASPLARDDSIDPFERDMGAYFLGEVGHADGSGHHYAQAGGSTAREERVR